MIKVQGTLRVKKILQSKNGPFAVGTLNTDVGEFKVKDLLLDQFDEGIYQVTAWISQVFLGHYITGGRCISEIRANLHDLQVQSEEQRGAGTVGNETIIEPDPLDELPPPVIPQAPATSVAELKAMLMINGPVDQQSKGAESASSATGSVPGPAPDDKATPEDFREFFSDDLWALIQARQPVKLDKTFGRPQLRKQSQMLNEELGYRFNSLDQTFYPVV